MKSDDDTVCSEKKTVEVIQKSVGKIPDVSIIIPVYNSAAWIGGTLQSVLSQSGMNLEIILADDGSSDRSLDTIMSLADERCTVLRFAENQGAASVRNTALAYARAEWICPFDSDDIMLPGLLAPYFEWVCNQRDVVWGNCGLLIADADGTPRNHAMGQPFDEVGMLGANIVNHGMSLIRRKALIESGGYESTVARGIDYTMMLKLTLLGPACFYNEVCFLYRMHEQSISHRSDYPLAQIHHGYRKWLQRVVAAEGPRAERAVVLLRILDLHDAVAHECWRDVAELGMALLEGGLDTFELKKLTVLGLLRFGQIDPAVGLLRVWLESQEPIPVKGPAAQRAVVERMWLADQVLRLILVTGNRELQSLGLPLAQRVQQAHPTPQLAALISRFAGAV